MQNRTVKNEPETWDKDAPEPKKMTLQVAETQKPMRIDVYLTRQVENVTRNKVQEAIAEQRVLVNGKPVKANYRIKSRDSIHITFLRPPAPELAPEDIPINILYEDDDLMVIDKAPGMVVHPAFGNWTGTLANAILHHLGQDAVELDKTDLRPGIVHRLDKNTSGLIIVAKNSTALHRLARQFARREVKKKYLALVWGIPEPAEGIIRTNIARSIRDRKIMACYEYEGGEGKTAVTEYRILKNFRHFALVELTLHTGRTHQIRVHLKHLGHPIVGDETYGGAVERALPFSKGESFVKNLLELLPRQALHAQTLSFSQPTSGERLAFTAPLPADMRTAIEKIERTLRPEPHDVT
ncbi:RNA pseudouridine synthase [Prosthecochloris sp. GSB1]|uniref:RluA family pseudouridine synthase n=1 Tax=Prosthecochloris sp. GSB1 TaxID=281093 RepID=UPI000B8CE5FE|nr:RluA family pseudouridine synthase [Prosthecochloris sp. GSB1]ASQ91623.1 RNA pseudouridine synthase [Prosthecochloris sp. GSB1]